MTMVQLFESIDNALILPSNAMVLKTYLGAKNLSDDMKESISYIVKDEGFNLILDGNKIKAVKNYSEIIKISPRINKRSNEKLERLFFYFI